MKKILKFCLLNVCFLSVIFAANLSKNDSQNPQKKIQISVSIAPLAAFVREICAKNCAVNVLIPKGANEHNFDFKPSAMKSLENSVIYFGVGLEFERVLAGKFSDINANLKLVDLGENLRNLENFHSHENHENPKNLKENSHKNSNSKNENSHENSNANLNENSHPNSHSQNATTPSFDLSPKQSTNSHENSHENLNKNSHQNSSPKNSNLSLNSKDPHIWLDPVLVKIQAEIIAKNLSEISPQNEAFFKENLKKFQAKLDSLNAEIYAILKTLKQRKFIIYHPSLAYFAARFDLEQIAVEIDGKEPKIKDLRALIDTAKRENIRTIFVQNGFSKSAAKSLKDTLGANIAEIDILSEDYFNELLKIAHNLNPAVQIEAVQRSVK